MRSKNDRVKRSARRGFSLLELLAVMSIMAMLTTLAVTSYFSAIQGMTRRSAVKHFVNALILARQRACLEGTRVSVVLFNEVTGYEKDRELVAPSFVVCKEIGRISFVEANKFGDEFSDLGSMFNNAQTETLKQNASYRGSIRIYNLTQGRWSQVRPWVSIEQVSDRESALKPGTLYDMSVFAFQEYTTSEVPNANRATWKIGDSYGIEASPINSLPRGFEFVGMETDGNNSSTKSKCITFQTDGRSTGDNGMIQIKVVGSSLKTTLNVQAEGSITYNEKWN